MGVSSSITTPSFLSPPPTASIPHYIRPPQSGVGSLILLFVVLRSHRLADSTLRFRMEALMFALLTLDMAYVLAFTAIKGDKLIIEDIVGCVRRCLERMKGKEDDDVDMI